MKFNTKYYDLGASQYLFNYACKEGRFTLTNSLRYIPSGGEFYYSKDDEASDEKSSNNKASNNKRDHNTIFYLCSSAIAVVLACVVFGYRDSVYQFAKASINKILHSNVLSDGPTVAA